MVKFFFFLLTFLLFLTVITQSQTRTIRGYFRDAQTGKRIANVMVFPCLKIDTVYANDRGKFRVLVASDFRGDLHYSHPHYNPYLERIKRRSNKTLHVIDLLADSFVFDTICYPSLPGNMIFEGRVFSKRTMQPVVNAQFQLKDQKRIGYSLNEGNYRVCVPASADYLLISQKDYKPRAVSVGELKINHKILLEPGDEDTVDVFKASEKNALKLMVNELIMGSVGIDYERFLKYKHSIGLKASFFLYNGSYIGIPFTHAPTPIFTGIKLSPYYRYYCWRNLSNAGFVEGKVSWGYFDFEEIGYKDPQYESNEDEYYWTFSEISRSVGFAGAFGWMIKSSHGPLIFNFSIGIQYMPLNVPSTKDYTIQGHTFHLLVNNPYWYVRVPGSVVEFKFMIGGIF